MAVTATPKERAMEPTAKPVNPASKNPVVFARYETAGVDVTIEQVDWIVNGANVRISCFCMRIPGGQEFSTWVKPAAVDALVAATARSDSGRKRLQKILDQSAQKGLF